MKRFAIFCVLMAMLTSCGARTVENPPADAAPPEEEPLAPVPELEIQPAPDVDPETGDRVLSSLSAVVDGGRVLRLDVVGQELTEPGVSVRYGVREVRVYDGETLLQTLSMGELPPGVLSGPMTQSPTIEDALTVSDMNFDGAEDVNLYAQVEHSADPHIYYLWSSDMGAYLYAFTLRGAEANPETRQVVATYKQDSVTDCTDYWRYEDGWTLVLAARETRDWKRGSEDFPLVEYYEFPEGEAVLIRQEFTNYNDEGEIAREVREVVDGELKPVRVEILEGADGEYEVVRVEEIPLATFPEETLTEGMEETLSPEDGETDDGLNGVEESGEGFEDGEA